MLPYKGPAKDYIDLLQKIFQLGARDDNANQKEQISFFRSQSPIGGTNQLDDHILRSILSDCDTPSQAIQHAVLWGDPQIIREQLYKTEEVEPTGIARAFESALVAAGSIQDNSAALRVVKVLMEFHVDSRHVCFDNLFLKKLNQYDLPGFEQAAANLKQVHDEIESNIAQLKSVRQEIAFAQDEEIESARKYRQAAEGQRYVRTKNPEST